MLKFNTYKNADGLFISLSHGSTGYNCRLPNYNLKINGKDNTHLKTTHHLSWFFLEKEELIYKVEELAKKEILSSFYELKDNLLLPKNMNLPKILSLEDVGEIVTNDDLTWSIKAPFYSFRSFYNRINNYALQIWKEVEFKVDHLGDITQIDSEHIKDIKYNIKTSSISQGDTISKSICDIACYSELDKMLHDEFVLHHRPCHLNADMAYKIIRQYIRENLDYSQAEIIRDFSFCFAVAKKLHIEPYEDRIEIVNKRGYSYKKPKYRIKEHLFETKEIFNMAPEKYEKYNVISEFSGETLKQLCDNLKCYLDNLIAVLNTPTKKCMHCDGCGCTFEVYSNEGGKDVLEE